jgi:hypothetical protein
MEVGTEMGSAPNAAIGGAEAASTQPAPATRTSRRDYVTFRFVICGIIEPAGMRNKQGALLNAY